MKAVNKNTHKIFTRYCPYLRAECPLIEHCVYNDHCSRATNDRILDNETFTRLALNWDSLCNVHLNLRNK